jgi:hypothetical protein
MDSLFKCKLCDGFYNPNYDESPIQFYLKGLCYACLLNEQIKQLEKTKLKHNKNLEREYKRFCRDYVYDC